MNNKGLINTGNISTKVLIANNEIKHIKEPEPLQRINKKRLSTATAIKTNTKK